MKKKIGIIVMICILMVTATDVKASKFAYSIGTNWGTSGFYTGDFTGNVYYAQMCYASIESVTSYAIVKPTPTFIRGNNPNGNRVIASKVVFLAGHGAAKRILFNHQYDTAYMTGVCAGLDKVDNGYTYAGLSSTDMSSCNLITFVGCQTAYVDANDYNLIEKAVARGATVAVGFKQDIFALSTAGTGWLRTYNTKLSEGSTVSESIAAAINNYPSNVMSTSVAVEGNINKSFNVTPISLEDESDEPTLSLQDQIDTPATEFECDYLKEKVQEMDESIDFNDYKVSVNMYDPNNGAGCAIFLYYMDDEIKTNKAYICHIKDNKLSEIVYSLEEVEDEDAKVACGIDEDKLLKKVNIHKNNKKPKTTIPNLVNLEEYKEEYYYDYKTNKLSYNEYTAINDPSLDVIVPEVNEVDL